MKRFLILILLVRCIFCFGQNIKKEIDSISVDFFNNSNNYGLAIGIIDKDDVKTFYYGGKTCTTGSDIDSLSIFEIGSVTKLYTGYLLAALEEDNIISKTDLLSKYLPKSISKNKEWENKIRLIDLMTHTSGLPSYDNTRALQKIKGFDENDPFSLFTKDFMFNILKNTDTIPDYGKVVYSNFGVGLAGYVIEKASGKNYKNLLEEYIINPFKLKSTFIHLREKEIINLAIPHRDNETMPLIRLAELEASGILKTTLPDLLQFIKKHIQPSDLNKEQIISSVLKNQLGDSETKVGIGWGIHNINNKTVYFHNGGTYGSSSIVIMNIESEIGIVLLANSNDESKLTTYALHLIEKFLN